MKIKTIGDIIRIFQVLLGIIFAITLIAFVACAGYGSDTAIYARFDVALSVWLFTLAIPTRKVQGFLDMILGSILAFASIAVFECFMFLYAALLSPEPTKIELMSFFTVAFILVPILYVILTRKILNLILDYWHMKQSKQASGVDKPHANQAQ